MKALIKESTVQQLKIVSIWQSPLLKNFIALGLVQATNFIIPLITFPYLVRIVGPERFGVISYGLTVMMYYIVLTEYSFSLSATRLVSIHRADPLELSKLFSNVMATKLLLLVISVLIMVGLCCYIPRFQAEATIYLFGMTYIFGSAIVPTWFFQGLEQMKYITYFNVIAKAALLILIFAIVKVQQDYRYVIGLYGVANVLSGFFSIWLAIRRYKLILKIPSFTVIVQQLRDGWPIFTSNLAVTLTNNTAVIVLGFFTTNISIGYYSIAEKIIITTWTILSLFSQAIYPTICRMAQESHQLLKRFIRHVCLPFIGAVAVGCLGLYVFAEEIVWLIAGSSNPEAVQLLKIMSIVPLIVSFNIPAYQTLLAYDLKKQYSLLFNSSAFLNLLVCSLFVHYLGLVGAAISMVVVQSLLTLSLHLTLELRSGQFSLLRTTV